MARQQTNGGPGRMREPGILIADDMALIPTLLKFELESRGFAVWLAVDGDDALDLYGRHREEIDLVLLKVQMSGLDGPHTLKALQHLNPGVVACFMSDGDDTYSQQELMDRGAAWVFGKPIDPTGVAEVLQQVATASDRMRLSCDWPSLWEG
jgi:CheY-like chemotaxis protein